MSNFCTACGKALNPASNFCIACGAASGRTAAPPPPTYPTPAPQQIVMASDSMDEMLYMQGTTPNQQLYFYSEMGKARKKPNTAFWWAFWLGGLGAQHFYLGNTGRAVAYLLFSWTGIPVIVSFIELFTIKENVRQMNSQTAAQIAMRVKMLVTA